MKILYLDKVSIFAIWFLLILVWNYSYPEATPFDDVFVAVCLALFSQFLEKRYGV